VRVVPLSKQLLRIAIFYALIALIFEWLISSWVRSWVPGDDTRIPFYFVMPIFFGITLAAVDRWVKTGPLTAVFVGALVGAISSIIGFELVRLVVIGADSYARGWRVLGWSNVGFGSLILGGWLPGGIASLGRYFQNRRAGGASGRA
jgi:hypothetical protein